MAGEPEIARLSTPKELKRLLTQAVVFPISLAVGLIAISLGLVNHLRMAEAWVEHSSEVLQYVHELKIYANEAQTDLRDYWVAGLPEALASLHKNQSGVEAELRKLEDVIVDNSEQKIRLERIHQSFAEWEALAQRSQETGTVERAKTVAEFRSASGKLKTQIAMAIDDFIHHERMLRHERTERTKELALFFLGMIAALVLMFGGAVAFLARSGILQVSQTYSAALAEAQQGNKTRDEFLSIASHELKTPLTLLKLQLQLTERAMTREGGEPLSIERLMDSSNLALRQVDALNALVDDLLDASRIQAGKFAFQREQVDLSDIVQAVVDRFSEPLRAAGCSIEVDLQRPLRGYWDLRRIEQIVVNLISNAIKYAPRRPLRISTSSGGDKAVLVVQDSGPGIPKEKQQLIFARFERAGAARGTGGLGLGLYIVKNIAESKGGKIWVESEVGHGAKFIVELPIRPSYAVTAPRKPDDFQAHSD